MTQPNSSLAKVGAGDTAPPEPANAIDSGLVGPGELSC